MNKTVYIRNIADHVGREIRLHGWMYNRRSSGKICFLIVRDGTGFIQCVAVKKEVGEATFDLVESMPQESSLTLTGIVREDPRAPGGYELTLTSAELVSPAEPYPISLKEHGVDFLMNWRHLWLRTPRQHALMQVRAEVIRASQEFLEKDGFIRIDAPVLTPAACEGTTTLFETDYFGDKAYLTQSGQLYAEAACMAFGKVYCYGPTFRAEKSKTRRHLTEFWMLEPEMAFYDLEASMQLQERLVSYIVKQVLERQRRALDVLGRDVEPLLEVEPPFPRLSYDDALQLLKEDGFDLPWGEDFGAPHEAAISDRFAKPVFVHRYPAQCKAFYMKPDPSRPEVVLCADLLAPEGYGEIIGGGQRSDDLEHLERQMAEHQLPREAYEWYLDLRRFGSVPHSGFGLGIERIVAWVAGIDHIREAIPFPRTISRIYP